MSKVKKTQYVCQQCGYSASKWAGQCGECESWNTLLETKGLIVSSTKKGGYSGQRANLTKLSNVDLTQVPRVNSGFIEFDRVLGGGIVTGSATLIGGDPGIGKSTLLIQVAAKLAEGHSVLYVTGEESLQQVAMRAKRLGLHIENIHALSETCVETVLASVMKLQPDILVLDSIQTSFSQEINSAPGSVSQVRECAAQLIAYAKNNQTALFLVGHVTKEGSIAGPRVLEHMVDSVLYFEGQADNRFRMIRAVKNRFGAANELGIFAMTDKGLKEISNPSAIFLTRCSEQMPGSVVMATWEGSRPMLVEVQALVDDSALGNPRRVCVGADMSRLTICLAVINRHGGVHMSNQDVYVNIVGGVKVSETGADLALVMALISSFKNKVIPPDVLVFGEVGLAGEVRPVQGGLERLKDAAKHGFKKAIVPALNAKQSQAISIEVVAVKSLNEAISYFEQLN